jgi:hypothetical protein
LCGGFEGSGGCLDEFHWLLIKTVICRCPLSATTMSCIYDLVLVPARFFTMGSFFSFLFFRKFMLKVQMSRPNFLVEEEKKKEKKVV